MGKLAGAPYGSSGVPARNDIQPTYRRSKPVGEDRVVTRGPANAPARGYALGAWPSLVKAAPVILDVHRRDAALRPVVLHPRPPQGPRWVEALLGRCPRALRIRGVRSKRTASS
jgi:hypothetical protein